MATKIEPCANRLSRALQLKGMKQAELCQLAGIPKGSLSLYLSGAYEPKWDRLRKMAKVLGVDEMWLMGYDVPKVEPTKTAPEEQMLSEGEETLLELFRQIPEDRKAVVLAMIRAALQG